MHIHLKKLQSKLFLAGSNMTWPVTWFLWRERGGSYGQVTKTGSQLAVWCCTSFVLVKPADKRIWWTENLQNTLLSYSFKSGLSLKQTFPHERFYQMDMWNQSRYRFGKRSICPVRKRSVMMADSSMMMMMMMEESDPEPLLLLITVMIKT